MRSSSMVAALQHGGCSESDVSPVSMQKSMTPADQMSALLPLYALYSSTSGATYLRAHTFRLCAFLGRL